ncbi:hypothetical protein GH714_016186 [Hevea brasiliensis]|uniref:Uncharacterized protein n=1 Tax=Hevea brasiliensis TaxID=3981 RepID=A0A6A6M0X6_HEVBR|nr:hypothetical protein GH714_016186 [Hevea brasiliensis]
MVSQCLGAIAGAGLVKAVMKDDYNSLGGGVNSVSSGYSKALLWELRSSALSSLSTPSSPPPTLNGKPAIPSFQFWFPCPWVCCVRSSFGHNSHHWHWHQPC